MAVVKDIMVKKVITAGSSDALDKICAKLIRNKLSGVPVVDKKRKLIGFISEKDIIAALSRGSKVKTVKDVMNKKVYSVNGDSSLDKVSSVFTNRNYRRLPVVEKGKLVGIVARKDIMGCLVKHYY